MSLSCRLNISRTQLRNQVSVGRGISGFVGLLAKREATADDHFQDEVISASSQADANTKIKLPLWRHIEINCREDLMLLVAHGIKTTERAERAVVFQPAIDLFRKGVCDFEIGGELKAALGARSLDGPLERRIEREVPALDVFVDDGSNLPASRVFGKLVPHAADLLRETDAHRPMPLWRNPKARSNMRADEVPSAAIARAGENVESRLEPVIEAVCYLDGLVPSVIGRQRTVIGLFRAHSREVVVQLDHGHAARDRFRSVDLDFVIVLGASQGGKQTDDCEGESYLGCGSDCQRGRLA